MKVVKAKGGIGIGTWNHRIIRHQTPHEIYLSIHEVHYDADGKLRGWTLEPVTVQGETRRELRDSLERMIQATRKPALTVIKLGKSEKLIEMIPGGIEAANISVKNLPQAQREELETLRRFIEGEIE